MKVFDVVAALEDFAPTCYAEDFDNVGLQVGSLEEKVSNVLVTLDVTEKVLDEALQKKCSLIVTFHPLIFSGLKSLSGEGRVESICRKAIRNQLSIYAIHTNLDNNFYGVNRVIANKISLKNYRVLIPKKETLYHLKTYVPQRQKEVLQEALFKAGAGKIGNYDNCSFSFSGEGVFKPNNSANPFLGTENKLHKENEVCLGVVVPKHSENNVVKALLDNHPYEEVAYELVGMKNTNNYIGMGAIGQLPNALSEKEFLGVLAENFNTNIRYSNFLNKEIKSVAVLGGSGSFAISAAKANGADAFITADLKYHDFFLAENKLLLCDIGHYESEQYTKDFLVDLLNKKMSTFATLKSEVTTNPINYFKHG